MICEDQSGIRFHILDQRLLKTNINVQINMKIAKIGPVEVVLSSSEGDPIPMCAIDEFCISRGLAFFP
jgi:hypothetical protein